MYFQKECNQPTSPWAGLNRNVWTELRQSKRAMPSDEACAIHITKDIVRSISTCHGRYPGWQVKLSDLPMQMHSGIERQPVAEGDACVPLRGQHTFAEQSASCFPFNCAHEHVRGHQNPAII